MAGDISIRWNSTYDMILRAMCLQIPLRNWLNEQIAQQPDLKCLALSTMEWKKLRYLIILLYPFAEYTSLIGNTRDTTINHTWNVYNALFDHLDMIQDQFHRKDVEKTPWISEFITAVDMGTEKLKEYYSKTGGPVETQYTLATMLDPSQKLSIFSSPEWGHLRCKKYMKTFVEHWSDYYQNLSVIKEDQPRSLTAPKTLNGIFRQHRQSIGPSRVNTASMNEAEQYLQAPLVGEDLEIPVLQLWKRIEPTIIDLLESHMKYSVVKYKMLRDRIVPPVWL